MALEEYLRRQNNTFTAYDEIFLHVFAPVLTEYVGWVLDQARLSGKRRLYFLARDGWLMYRAALKLEAVRKTGLELQYLKVSRYALRMAEYHLLGEKCLDTICVGGIDITFEKLMKRAALTEEEALYIADLTGYRDRYRTPITYAEIQRLKAALTGSTTFFQYVKQHSIECYGNAVGYLSQEGLLEEIPYAFVDSGWIGTTQASMEQLVSNASGMPRKLEGYYFGLYELPKGVRQEGYHCFYFSPWKDIRKKVRFSVCLFETVLSSPAGMTIGYRRIGDGYEAVESSRKNPNGGMMERNQELLEGYLDCYAGQTSEATMPADRLLQYTARENLHLIESLFGICMGTPTAVEADILGSLRFCDDVLELQMQDVAAPWDAEEIRKQRFFNKLLVKLGVKKDVLHESGWPEGSIVRAGVGVDGALRQERYYKYFMYYRKSLGRRTLM